MQKEVWKDVPGFEGLYEVSSLGRVRSLTRKLERPSPINPKFTRIQTYGGRVLKPSVSRRVSSTGIHVTRCFVTLCKDNVKYHMRVHRLVLIAFLGMPKDEMEGCHNDGNPLNNKLSNLRWDTRVSNARDKKKHGTVRGFKKGQNHMTKERLIGVDNPSAKLTEDQVREIRSNLHSEKSIRDLSKVYGVSSSTITSIKSRETWKHI